MERRHLRGTGRNVPPFLNMEKRHSGGTGRTVSLFPASVPLAERKGSFLRSVLIAGLMLCLIAGLAAWKNPARAEGEQTIVLRIRLTVEHADRIREDGSVYIGRAREKNRTAQLRIGTEGRLPTGRTADLSQLLREKRGTVISAWWRVEAKDCAKKAGRFLLWPKGDQKSIQSREILEGWNLWDVTELIRSLTGQGQELSLRLQAADGSGNAGAAFDLENSWISVRIGLKEGLEGEEERIEDYDLLDRAFSALPEGHWALEQYRNITDAIVIPAWPETGVPYYFGGHSEEKVLHPYTPSQPSKYYRTGKFYLAGFDCSSFIRWIEENTGYAPLDQLDQIILDRAGDFPVNIREVKNWMQAMLPGDLLVIDHGTYHVGMILGTPRIYGLTEQNAPELAGFLDSPMMIHCGEDPFCYDRFEQYIKGLSYRIPITPPDGGVTVSLLVSSIGEAPHTRVAPWKKEYGYFEVLGQQMTVYPVNSCRKLAWTRPIRADETELP